MKAKAKIGLIGLCVLAGWGCVPSRQKCYQHYPPVVIDSTFCVDTVVMTRRDTLTRYVHLGHTDTLTKVYEDSTLIVRARLAPEVASVASPVYQIQTIYKERAVKVQCPDTAAFMKQVRFMKAQLETVQTENEGLRKHSSGDLAWYVWFLFGCVTALFGATGLFFILK